VHATPADGTRAKAWLGQLVLEESEHQRWPLDHAQVMTLFATDIELNAQDLLFG
jgi:hypothetical protein